MKNISGLRPWRPGQSGNPGGKPVGTRNRITKKFLEALADDFEAHGRDAIAAAREKDPVGYMRAIVALCPHEMIIERPIDGLTDDELADIIEALRAARGQGDGDTAPPGGGAGTPGGSEPTGGVSSLH